MCPLTNSFISAVEKFIERSSGYLLINHDSSHSTPAATLSVLNLVVEQLDKVWEDGESSDDGFVAVVLLPGQDSRGCPRCPTLSPPSFLTLLYRRSQKPSISVCCECQLPVCPGMLG